MEYPKPAAVFPEDDDLDLDVSCRSNNVDNFEAGYPRTSNDMDFIVINDCNRSSFTLENMYLNLTRSCCSQQSTMI